MLGFTAICRFGDRPLSVLPSRAAHETSGNPFASEAEAMARAIEHRGPSTLVRHGADAVIVGFGTRTGGQGVARSRCGSVAVALDAAALDLSGLMTTFGDRPAPGSMDAATLLAEHAAVFGAEATLETLAIGHFACLIHDLRDGAIWMACDPSGARSLFYRIEVDPAGRPRTLRIANEAKALRRPGDRPEPGSVLAALLGHAPASDRTLCAHVHAVPPGGLVRFLADGTRVEGELDVESVRATRGDRTRVTGDVDAALGAYFTRAAAQCGTLGLVVHGDAWSAIVAASAVRAGAPMTLLFADTGDDARADAVRDLADCLDLPLLSMRATGQSIRANLVDAVWHAEQPLSGFTAMVPLYQLAHRAAVRRLGAIVCVEDPPVRQVPMKDRVAHALARGAEHLHRGARRLGIGRAPDSLRSMLLCAAMDQAPHRVDASARARRAVSARLTAAWGVPALFPLSDPAVRSAIAALRPFGDAGIAAHLRDPARLLEPHGWSSIGVLLREHLPRDVRTGLSAACGAPSCDEVVSTRATDSADGVVAGWLEAIGLDADRLAATIGAAPTIASDLLVTEAWARLFADGEGPEAVGEALTARAESTGTEATCPTVSASPTRSAA